MLPPSLAQPISGCSGVLWKESAGVRVAARLYPHLSLQCPTSGDP